MRDRDLILRSPLLRASRRMKPQKKRPNDVTLSELALEMLFPTDDKTVEIVKAMVRESNAPAAMKAAS